MILTGPEIVKEYKAGKITIDPFTPDYVNPNSYNYRLGPRLGVPAIEGDEVTFDFIEIPEEGYVMRPGVMYLGHTYERLGSSAYAMSLIGRSSLGRMGLFLQVSANLGHTGACHQWTLEIVAAHPFRLYPYMQIGQISFWENCGDMAADGDRAPYERGYSHYNAPTPSNVKVEK